MDPYLARAADALRDTAGAWAVPDLARRPAGKWSAAEIVEHLARAFSGTSKGLERVLASGAPATSRTSLQRRVAAFLVIDLGYLPGGRTSPAAALPTGADPATVLPLALENLRRMDDALTRVAAGFGTRVRVLDHPILGPLTVRQWRKFHWVHTRHHMRQLAARAQAAGTHG
jgi:hypothetical protein